MLYIICSLLSIPCFAQIVKQGEKFTEVPVFGKKITFIKEVPAIQNLSESDNFKILKEWASTYYGKDPFVSSIRYEKEYNKFIAKSRVELILPANSKGEREVMVMRYRINGFVYQDKCVLEITDISYLSENQRKEDFLPDVIRAEEFITDKALELNDFLELKTNTRKSTLFFLNEIGTNFERKFGTNFEHKFGVNFEHKISYQ
jgi:hypothetical protein